MTTSDKGLPFEHFIQALTTQLDRAQRAMAIKAKNGNLPLTFAVKDLSLDLRTHVEMRGSAVYIRPAAPNEADASTIHLNLTTITRPMIEENAVPLQDDADEPSLDEVLGNDGRGDDGDELRRRLEWAGIHRVSQLRQFQQPGQERELQTVTQLPLARLRNALSRVSQPRLSGIVKEARPQPEAPGVANPPLLRLRGDNLVRDRMPIVRLRGQPIPVLHATPNEIVALPGSADLSGALALEIEPGLVLETDLEQAYESSVGTAPARRER